MNTTCPYGCEKFVAVDDRCSACNALPPLRHGDRVTLNPGVYNAAAVAAKGGGTVVAWDGPAIKGEICVQWDGASGRAWILATQLVRA